MFSGRIRTTKNVSDLRTKGAGWFRFENLAAGETRIDIYDEISWWGITAASFLDELRGVTSANIQLHLNSPGGDVFDGIAIFNALKQHAATVNVVVDGIAASIASVIAMAGDSVAMAKGAMMMIHEPFAFVIGDSRDMRKAAESLDLMGDSIAGIYAERGGTTEAWRAAMAEETWYSDQGAVDAGLADSVLSSAAAKNTFDLSIFRNGPKAGRDEPVQMEDWRKSARARIAAAQLEVVRAHAH